MRGTAQNLTKWSLLAAFLLSNTLGCSEEDDPPQYLQNLRILAAEVTPLELDSQTTVDLRAFVHIPGDQIIVEESWSFCPVSLGAYGGFECINPGCESCLYHAGEAEAGSTGVCSPASCETNCFSQIEEDRAAGNCEAAQTQSWRPAISINPWDYFLSCFGELSRGAASGGSPAPGSDEIPESLEILFRYTVRTDAGEKREALVRVPFWTMGLPEAVNQPPVVSKVSVNGTELACGDVLPSVQENEQLIFKVEIDEESLDLIPTADEAGERKEDVFASYYCTAGRFDKSITDGFVMESIWEARKLEDGESETQINVIVRDERGGQTILGPYTIPIQRQ